MAPSKGESGPIELSPYSCCGCALTTLAVLAKRAVIDRSESMLLLSSRDRSWWYGRIERVDGEGSTLHI